MLYGFLNQVFEDLLYTVLHEVELFDHYKFLKTSKKSIRSHLFFEILNNIPLIGVEKVANTTKIVKIFTIISIFLSNLLKTQFITNFKIFK